MTKQETQKQLFDLYLKLEIEKDDKKRAQINETINTIKKDFSKSLVSEYMEEQKKGGRRR